MLYPTLFIILILSEVFALVFYIELEKKIAGHVFAIIIPLGMLFWASISLTHYLSKNNIIKEYEVQSYQVNGIDFFLTEDKQFINMNQKWDADFPEGTKVKIIETNHQSFGIDWMGTTVDYKLIED